MVLTVLSYLARFLLFQFLGSGVSVGWFFGLLVSLVWFDFYFILLERRDEKSFGLIWLGLFCCCAIFCYLMVCGINICNSFFKFVKEGF